MENSRTMTVKPGNMQGGSEMALDYSDSSVMDDMQSLTWSKLGCLGLEASDIKTMARPCHCTEYQRLCCLFLSKCAIQVCVGLERCSCSWMTTMCVSRRYLLNAYFSNWLRNAWATWWLQAVRSNTVDALCAVGACAGVYVDNVPCAATPPFPIFMEHCLPLQPWQQKMTNGRSVEMLRLWVRLNDRATSQLAFIKFLLKDRPVTYKMTELNSTTQMCSGSLCCGF